MQYNLNESGTYKLCSTPVGNKYRLTIDGRSEFITRQALNETIAKINPKFDTDLIETVSKDMLIWNLEKLDNCTNITAYFNINENILNASIKIHPSNLSIILENEISGITGMKIKKDISELLKLDETYIKECDRINNTLEGMVYRALRERIGDVSVLVDSIDFICNNGIYEAMVPIAIADNNDCSQSIIGKAVITDGIVDISDLESKIDYMLIDEDKLEKFNERLKKRVRINYRKYKNNGGSLKKDVKDLKNTIVKNNGHK